MKKTSKQKRQEKRRQQAQSMRNFSNEQQIDAVIEHVEPETMAQLVPELNEIREQLPMAQYIEKQFEAPRAAFTIPMAASPIPMAKSAVEAPKTSSNQIVVKPHTQIHQVETEQKPQWLTVPGDYTPNGTDSGVLVYSGNNAVPYVIVNQITKSGTSKIRTYRLGNCKEDVYEQLEIDKANKEKYSSYAINFEYAIEDQKIVIDNIRFSDNKIEEDIALEFVCEQINVLLNKVESKVYSFTDAIINQNAVIQTHSITTLYKKILQLGKPSEIYDLLNDFISNDAEPHKIILSLLDSRDNLLFITVDDGLTKLLTMKSRYVK
jgi:hypothetical protein